MRAYQMAMQSFCLECEGLLEISTGNTLWQGLGKEGWFKICTIGVIMRAVDVYMNVFFNGASV